MALTTEFIGSVVTTAESVTDWDNDTISAVEQWDLRIQGSYSNGFQASNKDGWGGYVMPSGSYDFTSTHAGMHVFIWMNYLSMFNLENVSTSGGGLYLIVGSSISNYKAFCVADSTTTARYNGGWKLWVIDPTKTATWTSGSPNMAAVTFFGVGAYTNASFRADNLFIDAIKVGHGIRAYGSGTSSDSWADITSDDMGTETARWGVVQEQDGIIYAYGRIDIGDDQGTSTTTFSDSGRIIQWVKQEYYDNTGTWVPLIADDFMGLKIVDNSTGSTTFTDGVIVGTDRGRSGSAFNGSSLSSTFVELGTNFSNSSSDINLYNTSFNKITGGITWVNDSDHVYYSGTVNECGQFDPVGAPTIRNCIFAQTSNVDAALLWNENINIQDCNFIANTTGAAIEMPSAAGTPYSYIKLYFSGNTYDVLNSSGSAITVAKQGTPGSNPSTYEGSTVSFTASFTHTLTGLVENTEVTYVRVSDGAELFHVENVTATGETNYSHSGGETVDILIVHLDYDPDISNIYNLTLPNADASVPIKQIADAYYDNP